MDNVGGTDEQSPVAASQLKHGALSYVDVASELGVAKEQLSTANSAHTRSARGMRAAQCSTEFFRGTHWALAHFRAFAKHSLQIRREASSGRSSVDLRALRLACGLIEGASHELWSERPNLPSRQANTLVASYGPKRESTFGCPPMGNLVLLLGKTKSSCQFFARVPPRGSTT